MSSYKYLNNIDSPQDLKALNDKELEELCGEIRTEMIETVSTNGGHLASNLGVVELTVALHAVFDSPKDQIVFDVGHQCYTHKLLTGRREQFETLRKKGGISGFPKPCESVHDPVITGHSSTSISSMCGLAKAKTLQGEDGYSIAVIGDGALSGGMAYEGLNNAGRSRDKMIVILNDNKMSISRNVGSMARYLAVIRTKSSYIRMKGRIDRVVSRIPIIGKKLRKVLYGSKVFIKNALYGSTMFENMGFIYIGPVDGHDMKLLKQALNVAKEYKKPVFIHVCTIKGKGYTYAEKNPRVFHGISGFNIETGDSKMSGESYSDVFGDELCNIARTNDKICAVTAAMKSGTGLNRFSIEYMNRFFDVGIAEQHAVTFCGGLAANGMIPVFAVYSSFLQRGFDQIIHDVAIQNLKVIFAIDRAGIVGEDGETHQGLYDCAFLNGIPNVTVYAPSYFSELRLFMRCAVDKCIGPAAVRFPRGKEILPPAGYVAVDKPFTVYGSKSDILLVTYGRCFSYALEAVQLLKEKGIDVTILKLNRIKPIAAEAVEQACEYNSIFFFEEGERSGGIGERFALMLLEKGFKGQYKLTATEGYVAHASVAEILHDFKLDAQGMSDVIIAESKN